MSTRGVVGVKIDGLVKCVYNHSDSYPSGLGLITAEEVSCAELEECRTKARRWIDTSHFEGEVEVNGRKVSLDELYANDWGLVKKLDCPYYDDAKDFMRNGLFCEWGYIWDLDHNMFKVYKNGNLFKEFEVDVELPNVFERELC